MKIAINTPAKLTIEAKEKYSSQIITVEESEVYEFLCDKQQRWKDWFVKSGPDGYFNLLAWIAGLRVKGVKCFCLCGAYNNNDKDAFCLGSAREVEMKYTGELSFFANDTKGFYFNNKGAVDVIITRKR